MHPAVRQYVLMCSYIEILTFRIHIFFRPAIRDRVRNMRIFLRLKYSYICSRHTVFSTTKFIIRISIIPSVIRVRSAHRVRNRSFEFLRNWSYPNKAQVTPEHLQSVALGSTGGPNWQLHPKLLPGTRSQNSARWLSPRQHAGRNLDSVSSLSLCCSHSWEPHVKVSIPIPCRLHKLQCRPRSGCRPMIKTEIQKISSKPKQGLPWQPLSVSTRTHQEKSFCRVQPGPIVTRAATRSRQVCRDLISYPGTGC